MRIVIIGGGVIGLTSAYELTRQGAEVTLVDDRTTAGGASETNAGWVCPAESGPVPAPGMFSQALRWMLRRDSPLYVRPSLDPAFLRFMLTMARHCNRSDYRAGMRALIRLAEGTMDRLDAYRDDGLVFEMHAQGLLMAFLSKARLDAQYPHERHLDPPTFSRALRERCLELGVELLGGATVEKVDRSSARVVAVHTAGQRLTADAFLLAAGAWSGPLAKQLDVGLPIRPGKGYSLDLPPHDLRQPVYLTEAKVAVTPLAGRLRLAGTMEFGTLEEQVDPVRAAAIGRAPASFLREWHVPEAPELGAGLRPMSPDGLPLIGRLEGLENAYISTGHAMLGLTLAPSSAAAIAGLILHGEQMPAMDPFRPDRFAH